jgi:hypothetical protein
MCCQGSICSVEYQTCCNSTCCNKFSATCTTGKTWRQDQDQQFANQGAGAFANTFYSDRDFHTAFAVCSEIESLTITRAFWVYILPAALIFFTLVGTGLVWTFALRATDQGFKLEDASTPSNTTISKLLWAVGTLEVLFAVFLYFSPQFTYGVLTTIGGLFLIAAVASKTKWIYTFAALYQVFLILLYIDPFQGNAFLNFSHLRNDPEVYTEGPASPAVVQSNGQSSDIVRTIWHNIALNNPLTLPGQAATDQFPQRFRTGRHTFRSQHGRSACAAFYEYFEYDPSLQDLDREDNFHDRLYGYCSRSWTFVLLLAALIEIILIFASVVFLTILIVTRILSDKNFKYNWDPNAYEYSQKDKIVGAVGFEQ